MLFKKELERGQCKHLKHINQAGTAPERICFQVKIVTDGGDILGQRQHPKKETQEVKGGGRIFGS